MQYVGSKAFYWLLRKTIIAPVHTLVQKDVLKSTLVKTTQKIHELVFYGNLAIFGDIAYKLFEGIAVSRMKK